MLRIAIQNKGRLYNESITFLKTKGITVPDRDRELLVSSPEQNIEFLFVRDDDICTYVDQAIADIGIIGADIYTEQQYTHIPILDRLGSCECRLVIAVPETSTINAIADLSGERIATSFPNILTPYLIQNNIHASIIKIKGSVEVAPALNLADSICDLTQTGSTLKANKLKEIQTIFNSEAILIGNKEKWNKFLQK